jgi:2-methylcitrate dehydratase PrpD
LDRITEQLVTYSSEFSEAVITESVREAMRRHIMDTIACAIAGYDLEAPAAAGDHGQLPTKGASVAKAESASAITRQPPVMLGLAGVVNVGGGAFVGLWA